MTHYEKVTRDEIARRNYSEGTTRAYLRTLHDLAGYFQRPPERLTPEQIREYTAHLFSDRKLSGNTVNQMVGALRFFYLTVLNKPWRGHEMPYPKKTLHLPVIWSPDEVASLINAAPTAFYRTIIMTLYATGLRRAEVAALKTDRRRLRTDGAACSGGQRPQGPRRRAESASARGIAATLSAFAPQTGGVVVSGRHASYRRHSHHREGRLARVPPRGQTLRRK